VVNEERNLLEHYLFNYKFMMQNCIPLNAQKLVLMVQFEKFNHIRRASGELYGEVRL